MRHVADIAEKYLIPGETQDTALMFVPSESVYAEIHDGFDDVIQKAYRARVVLVSPSLLMLAIQVMQQILKDARMRDAADQIRTEVLHLGDDLARLRERVAKLQTHFGQVNDDVRQILVSADKIERRAARIEELDFAAPEKPAPQHRRRPRRRSPLSPPTCSARARSRSMRSLQAEAALTNTDRHRPRKRVTPVSQSARLLRRAIAIAILSRSTIEARWVLGRPRRAMTGICDDASGTCLRRIGRRTALDRRMPAPSNLLPLDMTADPLDPEPSRRTNPPSRAGARRSPSICSRAC